MEADCCGRKSGPVCPTALSGAVDGGEAEAARLVASIGAQAGGPRSRRARSRSRSARRAAASDAEGCAAAG